MIFKPHETAYLRPAELGRLATVQPSGSPQVSPVGFTYNEQLQTIDISGYRMSQSRKFRNLATNNKVAFVVDDIASRDPWRVRCLEIRGTAEQAALDPPIIRITPQRIISFGIDDTDTEPHLLTPDKRNVTA
ncbi:MAG: pyridoxamine 5-phosphate oxidase [Mycobacterium sp.]|jgi:pyridoxamine 5'-phosphate oxidase family protein|nr:pyridoxamine 5-phosphate oxidase [Mycobacterium sp.]